MVLITESGQNIVICDLLIFLYNDRAQPHQIAVTLGDYVLNSNSVWLRNYIKAE